MTAPPVDPAPDGTSGTPPALTETREVTGREEPAPHVPEDLAAYQRRCERITRLGAQAQVVYEAAKDMTVGDTETVKAAVSLDLSAPAREVLPRTEAMRDTGLLVSCRLQARLEASRYEFEVDRDEWVDRSLFGTDTARWVWQVTPKLGGRQVIVLSVRPIAILEQEASSSSVLLAANADVRSYDVEVDVGVPWSERPAVVITQIASVLNVAEGLVKAIAALLAAIAGVLVAARALRRRRAA